MGCTNLKVALFVKIIKDFVYPIKTTLDIGYHFALMVHGVYILEKEGSKYVQ